MPSLWHAATRGWNRKVFHCPQLTQIFRNSRPLYTIYLQIPSLVPLEMRKVQQRGILHSSLLRRTAWGSGPGLGPDVVEEIVARIGGQVRGIVAQLPDRSDCVLGFVQEDLRGLENRLAAYPGNTARMQGKVERLREMQERGVIPYTVWDFPFRGDYAGDGSYNGNCYPQIIEQCVWRLTEEGEVVMDPWRGPGCYDLHPVRGDIEQADARRLPAVDGQADLVFMHPPYWDMVRYSGGAVEGDLSRAASLEQFFDMLRQVFSECERVLRPGRYLCVFLGDLINGGRFQPLGPQGCEHPGGTGHGGRRVRGQVGARRRQQAQVRGDRG